MTEHVDNVLRFLLDLYNFWRPLIPIVTIMPALVLIARQFEKKWPIDPELTFAEVASDWKVTSVNVALGWATKPLTAITGSAIVNAAGGGFIHFRSDGWWYGLSLLGFILAMDLYRYTSHRLYHAVPFLWALHSFHHSAEALTFFTGARHHWIERTIESAFFPIMAILFKIPGDVLFAGTFIMFLPDGCAHLNVRIPLGRAVTWLNSPQWHRIHHSTQPEHFNKNFASVLPLWDIVFGTAWIPREDEYPATGLVPGEKCDIVTSIVWPFRHFLRRLQSRVTVWPGFENFAAMRKVFAKDSGTPTS
jgi:sterol desaturase/sphingolipid hydroxylase (fatty acid hydroxylase superfamily)